MGNIGQAASGLMGGIKKYSDPIQGIMGLLSTGLGAYSQVRSGREASKQRERLYNLSRAPLRTTEHYTQMTETERKAFERQIHAELTVRGIPRDSAYATALTSELMAKRESERLANAQQVALGQRGEAINAITGMPAYPAGGDVGAFGKFLGLQSILDALRQFRGGGQQPQAQGARLRDPGQILFNPETYSQSLYGPDQWEEALGGPLTTSR